MNYGIATLAGFAMERSGILSAVGATINLSEPKTGYLLVMIAGVILLRRRPFARSGRHPAVSAALQRLSDLRESLMFPLRRKKRTSVGQAMPWISFRLEGLEGRQLMSGSSPASPPFPPSVPPSSNEPPVEHHQPISEPKNKPSKDK
jgi:hypothetical protein